MKLGLRKRPAQIGPSINTRTEHHGEEDIPGIDIPLKGLLLSAEEINEILGDPGSHEALFGGKGPNITPRWEAIEYLPIAMKFQKAKVSFEVDGVEFLMKPAKVHKIRLAPQEGGLTAMDCTVTGSAPAHLDVLALLNRKCKVAIQGGELIDRDDNQPELPMPGAEPGAEDSDGDEEPPEDNGNVVSMKRGRRGKKK